MWLKDAVSRDICYSLRPRTNRLEEDLQWEKITAVVNFRRVAVHGLVHKLVGHQKGNGIIYEITLSQSVTVILKPTAA